MLAFDDGRPFAQGAAPYLDRHADDPGLPRLVVQVALGTGRTAAVVDTGAPFFICDPEVLLVNSVDLGEALGTERLLIRGVSYRGELHRLPITLVAEHGQSLDVEVSAFIPVLEGGDPWPLPTFLGLQGCLEFTRFAVDPATSTFYFGALADEPW